MYYIPGPGSGAWGRDSQRLDDRWAENILAEDTTTGSQAVGCGLWAVVVRPLLSAPKPATEAITPHDDWTTQEVFAQCMLT